MFFTLPKTRHIHSVIYKFDANFIPYDVSEGEKKLTLDRSYLRSRIISEITKALVDKFISIYLMTLYDMYYYLLQSIVTRALSIIFLSHLRRSESPVTEDVVRYVRVM